MNLVNLKKKVQIFILPLLRKEIKLNECQKFFIKNYF